MKPFYILLLLAVMIACKDEPQGTSVKHNNMHASAETYTCPMHPQVTQDHPGSCPICGMDLVKVVASGSADDELMLTDTQIRLGNITVARATRKPVGETIVVNGVLTVNKERSEVVSSRAPGRVEKLYIKETGRSVKKGEPLYVLYSELLLTLESEYLLAREQSEKLGEQKYASFAEAAREKLLHYGLTNGQIDQLKSRQALSPRVVFLAPVSGIITDVAVLEGQQVEEGAPLYSVEDIRSLWVEAELYPGESALVNNGDSITVNVPSGSVEARVTFLSPEYRASSLITVMRAEISNDDLQFQPGQQAQILFTHSSHNGIAVPPDAVIRDAKGSYVFVQSGENVFRQRAVTTGIAGAEVVEVIAGLNEGDTVVVSGAYLLYSSLALTGGHNHGTNF